MTPCDENQITKMFSQNPFCKSLRISLSTSRNASIGKATYIWISLYLVELRHTQGGIVVVVVIADHMYLRISPIQNQFPSPFIYTKQQ